MKHVLLGLAACTWSLLASAQQYHCATDRMRAERIAADPSYLEREAALEADIQQLLRNGSSVERGGDVVVTIPIVFHIIHVGGPENITNEQILNQVDILNEDYRALNTDISQVHPAFADLVGDARIRFVLPTLDPDGNCTNGIDRIKSPETLRGSDRGKMNPWPRERYLNVWVIKYMENEEAAGYAYYPSAFDSPIGRLADGIIIEYDYVGSISPGSPFRSTALTHEVGHYLNLPHVWGSNNTTEGGVPPAGHMIDQCGDDGVYDTPVTKGWNICPDYNDVTFGWADCDRLSLVDHKYTFSGVTTSSGTTDPTPRVNPQDTINNVVRVRAEINAFSATGVANNSSVPGMFAFSGWDAHPINGETVYAELPGTINTGKYYSFSFAPKVSDLLYVDSIGFKLSRNTTGVRTFAVRSSANNYSANLPIRAAGNPNISIQTGNVAFIKNDVALSDLMIYVDPPAANFHYTDQTITFRLYAWNAETMNSVARVCDNATADLFDFLGGAPQPGGSWSGPSAMNGIFDPATMSAGTYTYTVDVPGCATYTATVDVSVISAPSAPVISGASAFCAPGSVTLSSSPATNLTWSTGQTTATIAVTTAGTYTVTHTQGECKATSAPFVVEAHSAVNAGTDGTLTLCESSPAADMFTKLGGTPQAGGTWTGPSPVTDGLYDPLTMEPGVYEYTLADNGACAGDVAQVTVTETATANAGTTASASICTNATLDLFTKLGGGAQPGGIWTNNDVELPGGIYDAEVHSPGAYVYTVDLGGDCGSATATVNVTEINAPAVPTITGNNAFCAGGSVQLMSSSSTGNTWSPGGTTTPGLVVTRPGTYTLRVTNPNGCFRTTSVEVNERSRVNAGGDGMINVCADATDIDLFAGLTGASDAGGTWTGPSTVIDGLYQPASMQPGVYSYVVAGTSPCPNDTAIVTVSESSDLAFVDGYFGVDDVTVYGSTNVIENVENYMEYSYCSKMFTIGQTERMHAALNHTAGERNNLWTEANLQLTGVAEGYQASCPPQADFYARTSLMGSDNPEWPYVPAYCAGTPVQFVDNSVGGFPTAWAWTFQDGTPATSTERNPVVSFEGTGFKEVTLTVTNANGSTTKVDPYAFVIGGTPNDHVGLYSEGFETTTSLFPWLSQNHANNITSWRRTTTAGNGSNACVMLNSGERDYLDLIDSPNGADYDDFYSPTFDLSGLSEASFQFSFAYSTTASDLALVTERLLVSISTDCGRTWSLLPNGELSGAQLINNGNNPQLPPPAWTDRTFNLNAQRRVANVRFRFRYISSEYSGNLYIDNINIIGAVGVEDLSSEKFMNLYPNPTNDQFTLGVHGMDKYATTITITDIRGAVVHQRVNAPSSRILQFSAAELNLANGLYLIKASNEAGHHTQKLMVGK